MAQRTMKEMILESVRANEHHMDSKEADLTEPLWTIFGEAVIAIQGCFGPVMDSKNEDDQILFLMCCNALSDSFAALMLIRQGFLRPPAIVMRGVVENLAAAVAFLEDENALKKFKKDKYNLPKAMTSAKKHFPELATHYGVLTNKFTHETFHNLGRCMGKEQGIFFIPVLDGRQITMGQPLLALTVAMIVHNIGQIVEFCFIRYLKAPTLWEREGGGQIRMKMTDGRKLITVLGAKLEAAMADGSPQDPDGLHDSNGS